MKDDTPETLIVFLVAKAWESVSLPDAATVQVLFKCEPLARIHFAYRNLVNLKRLRIAFGCKRQLTYKVFIMSYSLLAPNVRGIGYFFELSVFLIAVESQNALLFYFSQGLGMLAYICIFFLALLFSQMSASPTSRALMKLILP